MQPKAVESIDKTGDLRYDSAEFREYMQGNTGRAYGLFFSCVFAMRQEKKMETRKKQGRIAFVLHYMRGSKRLLLLGAVASVLSIVFNFLLPQAIRVTVDSVLGELPFDLPDFLVAWIEQLGGRVFLRENLIVCALAVVAFSVLSGLSNLLCRVSIAKFSERTLERLRDGLYGHIQRLPYKWHVQVQTGDIIQRCTSDVDVLRNFLAGQLLELFRTVILVVIAAYWMFSMNVKMTLVSLSFIPVVVLYSAFFFRSISRRFQTADEAEGDLQSVIQENLTGVRVVRAFGREAYEIENFDKKNTLFTRLWIRLAKVMGLYWGLGDMAMALQIMVIIILGVSEAVHGNLTLGEFTVFISYNSTMAWPIRSFGRVLSEMSKLKVSLERLKEIADAEEENDTSGEEPPMDRDIVFDHVSFSYESSGELLRDVSFTIPAGSTVGILGGTGTGKSTLTYLLTRLYDIEPGCGGITVGGVDLRDIRLSHVRKNIGLVLQEPFLFSKTISENILAARSGATQRDLDRVSAIAALEETIRDLPQGYDTVIGERGVTLSGGQKQRVAIARMLIQNTPVKIFDDSLSAVDTETDAKIRAALRENADGATTIIISHRVTTLMHADKIVVLSDGKVTQEGTHDELIAREGEYKRIYDIQGSLEAELAGGEAQ